MKSKSTRKLPLKGVLSASLLLVGYVGSYFVVLVLPPTVHFPRFLKSNAQGFESRYVEINGEWSAYPYYHDLPAWIFAPIHKFDRAYLRPGKWSGSFPRNTELSFEWLLGQQEPKAIQYRRLMSR